MPARAARCCSPLARLLPAGPRFLLAVLAAALGLASPAAHGQLCNGCPDVCELRPPPPHCALDGGGTPVSGAPCTFEGAGCIESPEPCDAFSESMIACWQQAHPNEPVPQCLIEYVIFLQILACPHNCETIINLVEDFNQLYDLNIDPEGFLPLVPIVSPGTTCPEDEVPVPSVPPPVQGVSPPADSVAPDCGASASVAGVGQTTDQSPGEPWMGKEMLGDIDLYTGGLVIDEVDLSLPAPGFRWTVGRSYGHRQVAWGGGHHDSNGHQGWNWFQTSQPHIRVSGDYVFVIFGAEQMLVMEREGSSDDTFQPVQGSCQTAGMVLRVAPQNLGEPGLYQYIDQRGVVFTFLDHSTDAGAAKGQLWTIVDPAGNMAYVGDTSLPAAISSGFDADGRMTNAYDTAGRRYVYTYGSTAVGGAKRLEKVAVTVSDGLGGWEATGDRVEYEYYGTGATGNGSAGDLKLVKVLTPTSEPDPTPTADDPYVSVASARFYRYWDDTWSSTAPGHPHFIRYRLGFEGARQLDMTDGDIDFHYTAETGAPSDSTIAPFAEGYYEYHRFRQVDRSWSDGQCGCGSAASGLRTYRYEMTFEAPTLGWNKRTMVGNPDGSWITQYFVARGGPTTRVISDRPPDQSAANHWVTQVVRDTGGRVIRVHTPANITAYDHGTGLITNSDTVGLVYVYNRHTSGAGTGFISDERWRVGDGDDSLNRPFFLRSYTYQNQTVTIDGHDLVRPMLASTSVYPVATETLNDTTAEVTSYSYSVHSGTVIPKVTTTTLPIVDDSENGSEQADTIAVYTRLDDTVAFTKSASGIYTYTRFVNGQLAERVEDCDLTATFVSGDDPSTFGIAENPAPYFDLSTEYFYDAQGRLSQVERPDGRRSGTYYSRLADHRFVSLSFPLVDEGAWESSAPDVTGPASYAVTNHHGGAEFSATVAVSSVVPLPIMSAWINEAQSTVDPLTALNSGGGAVARLRTTLYSQSGARLEADRVYFDIPASGTGAAGTNFDETSYAYDAMGRRIRLEDATGTIDRYEFDSIGRPVATWIGTDDSTWDPPNDYGNLVTVESVEYDNGSASGGNSLVTSRRRYTSANDLDPRVTSFLHDTRDRSTAELRAETPHIVRSFDNLGRVIAVAFFGSGGTLVAETDPVQEATSRLGLAQRDYDSRGMVWRTRRYQIDPETGGIVASGGQSQYIDDLSWYDADGREVKRAGAELRKRAYDRLGTVLREFGLAHTDDSEYADAVTVAGDTVLEETQYYVSAATRLPMLRLSIARHHTDQGTGRTMGSLDGDDTLHFVDQSEIAGRITSISAFWYDELHRLTDTVEFGTNGGNDLDRTSLAMSGPPARSGSALRMTNVYSADGSLDATIDSMGRVTRTERDDAGRVVLEIRNYNASDPTITPEQNLHTRYSYVGGNLIEMHVDLDGDGTKDLSASPMDQVTEYTYGVSPGTAPGQSQIASRRLLGGVTYPHRSVGQTASERTMVFAYNAQGERTWVQDQAGNQIDIRHDNTGREVERSVVHLEDGFDGLVRSIRTAYDDRGFVRTVGQYDVSDTIIDEVSYEVDGWGLLQRFRQDHNSLVGASGSVDDYEIAYDYALAKPNGGRHSVRRTQEYLKRDTSTQQTITLGYSNSSSSDFDIGRVTAVSVGAVVVAEYRYLGTDQVIDTALPAVAVYSRVHDGGTPLTYPGLDGFGRRVHDVWRRDAPSNPDFNFVSLHLRYDANSNVTSVTDDLHRDSSGNHLYDAKYTMDGLGRVVGTREGHLNQSTFEIGTSDRKREELWELSQTGNWDRRQLDLNGNGTIETGSGELDDIGTFNAFNQLLERDTDANNSPNVTLLYDRNGNTTRDGTYKLVYDPFGRLRKVLDPSNDSVVAEYTYNGLGFQITRHVDLEPDGDVDGSDPVLHQVYDDRWRLRAVYTGHDEEAKEQFVLHQAGLDGKGGSSYIDLVVCRDRDADTDPEDPTDEVREERVYLCQNWRADVAAVLRSDWTSLPALLEWTKYSTYGEPDCRGFPDLDADGAINSNDISAWNARFAAAASSFDPRMDSTFDGVVNSTDTGRFLADWLLLQGTPCGRGEISRADTKQTLGFAGYRWDQVSSKYHPRNRVFDPGTGLWFTTDRLQYVDGVNLYSYAKARPTRFVDPLGLCCVSTKPEQERMYPRDPPNTVHDWPSSLGDGGFAPLFFTLQECIDWVTPRGIDESGATKPECKQMLEEELMNCCLDYVWYKQDHAHLVERWGKCRRDAIANARKCEQGEIVPLKLPNDYFREDAHGKCEQLALMWQAACLAAGLSPKCKNCSGKADAAKIKCITCQGALGPTMQPDPTCFSDMMEEMVQYMAKCGVKVIAPKMAGIAGGSGGGSGSVGIVSY